MTVEKAIEILSDVGDINRCCAEDAEALDMAIKALEQQPTRPTGKWIEKEDYNLDTYYECSECGEDYCIEGDILIHKYCPNCGARMEAETKIDQGLNFADQDAMMSAT